MLFHSKRSMIFFPLHLPRSLARVLNLFLELNNLTLSFEVRWRTSASSETWVNEITVIEHTNQWRLKSNRKEVQREVGCTKNEVQNFREDVYLGGALVWLHVRERIKILKISVGEVRRLHSQLRWVVPLGLPAASPVQLTGCWAEETQQRHGLKQGSERRKWRPLLKEMRKPGQQEWEWEVWFTVEEMFCKDLIHSWVLA